MMRVKKDLKQAASLPATGYLRQAQLVPHIILFSADIPCKRD